MGDIARIAKTDELIGLLFSWEKETEHNDVPMALYLYETLKTLTYSGSKLGGQSSAARIYHSKTAGHVLFV